MSSTIPDGFSVWSSECPSDEEIGLSDCFDDSLELAILEQPTCGTEESRTPRAASSSTGSAAGSFFLVIPQAAALVVLQATVSEVPQVARLMVRWPT